MNKSTDMHEAASWFVSLQAAEVSREQQEGFAAWLRRSPVHVEQFLQLTALQGDLARLPELQELDVSALLEESARAPDQENVVLLGADLASAQAPRRRLRLPAAVAAAIAAVAAGLLAYAPISERMGVERHVTETGEQRSVVLADGSQVQLNVRSDLSVKVTARAREVRLEGGEALFDVAKDTSRPFRVHTPQATILAVGTQFNVHVKDGMTVVALLEGRVEVRRPGGGAPVLLDAGQEVTVTAGQGAVPAPEPADIRTVIAWTERRLVFEDVPLSEVVAEFNRYSRQQLLIGDPSLGGVRITASFDSANVRTFADSLASARGLRVERRADEAWVIERQ